MPFNSASDAFELHPDVRSYGTPLSGRRGGGRARSPRRSPRRDVVSNARARFSAYETHPPPAVVARPAPASALERVLARGVADWRDADAAAAAAANPRPLGAFYTLVPIRPRWRCGRRSLRTLPVASLRQPLAFIPRPRRLSTPLLTPFNSTPPFACIERPLFRRSLERRAATRSFVVAPAPADAATTASKPPRVLEHRASAAAAASARVVVVDDDEEPTLPDYPGRVRRAALTE